jgi:protein-L-isoaspartate(D-aspartate) O-methyltransferase
MLNLERERTRMIDADLRGRGITDRRVLEAFRSVPRQAFVPDELAGSAYEDHPLPIGEGQTISQPYVVALMVQSLHVQNDDRVLEVGTGSGYAAAILSHLAKEVFTMERIRSLADSAKERLSSLGFSNVEAVCGDGSVGWPEHAPYDAIAVAAGVPRVPRALTSQLAIGGRLVIPIGPDPSLQALVCVTRERAAAYRQERLTRVRFVPLVPAKAAEGRVSDPARR